MASRQIQINALIAAIAGTIRNGGSAEAAATATGLRRAVWATLTEAQQVQVLAAARRRATTERGILMTDKLIHTVLMRKPEPGIYSIGELRDPRPEDTRYDSQIEAETIARKESWPGRILGIWRDADGELAAIAYDGMVYWP